MVDWAARVEDHLLGVMYLAKTAPGCSYDAMMHWPVSKLRSRIRHCGYWIEREEKATEAASRSGK